MASFATIFGVIIFLIIILVIICALAFSLISICFGIGAIVFAIVRSKKKKQLKEIKESDE